MNYRSSVIVGLSGLALVFPAATAVPAWAQDSSDPRVLRTDATGIILFDGLVTLPRRASYEVEEAYSRATGDELSVFVDIAFTAADMADGGCSLEMARTEETDMESGRSVLREVLSDFNNSVRNRTSDTGDRNGPVVSHGNSNSIDLARPYLSTYKRTQRGGHEVKSYYILSQNGRLYAILNECTFPGNTDLARVWSDFPIRLRP